MARPINEHLEEAREKVDTLKSDIDWIQSIPMSGSGMSPDEIAGWKSILPEKRRQLSFWEDKLAHFEESSRELGKLVERLAEVKHKQSESLRPPEEDGWNKSRSPLYSWWRFRNGEFETM